MFITPTTGAIAECRLPRYEDATGNPHPDFMTLTVKVTFNGLTGELEDTITYARGSLMSVKNAAARTLINRLLASSEPGVSLTQANIEIQNMPT